MKTQMMKAHDSNNGILPLEKNTTTAGSRRYNGWQSFMAAVAFGMTALFGAVNAYAENWANIVNVSEFPVAVNGTNTITTARQLAAFAKVVNNGNNFSGKTIVLANDINVLGYDWTPIGNGEYCVFQGTFDGRGYTVKGVTIPYNNSPIFAGFFGIVGGTVRNVNLVDTRINARVCAGGVAGANSGLIANCSNNGYVIAYTYFQANFWQSFGDLWYHILYVPAKVFDLLFGIYELAAYLIYVYITGEDFTINELIDHLLWINKIDDVAVVSSLVERIKPNDNNASVISHAGGIVGINYGVVKNCSNSSNVNATSEEDSGANAFSRRSIYSYAGGMAGENMGIILNCSNKGGISAESDADGLSKAYPYAGGITGKNDGGIIQNCLNRGAVKTFWLNLAFISSTSYEGGVAGRNTAEGTVTHCYWKNNSSSGFRNGAIGSGTGSTLSSFNYPFGMLSTGVSVGNVVDSRNLQEVLNGWVISNGSGAGYLGWRVETNPVMMEEGYPFLGISQPTATFNFNNGTSGSSAVKQTFNDKYVLPSSTPTRIGYTFVGWFTAPTGGTQVTTGSRVANASDHTLWAQWRAHTYTVVYNGNQHTGGSTANTIHTYDTPQALRPIGFSRTGHAFMGWATSASGNVVYTDGDSILNLTAVDNGTVTLYAKWTTTIINYTVSYNANGGSGTTASSSHTHGMAKALTASGFTRTGYTFAGWSLSASGNVDYANGESVLNLSATSGATVILYAKWSYNNKIWVDVNASSSNDSNDGKSREKAKKTIQAAIDIAVAGDEIIVVAGTYTGSGSSVINASNKAITIRSESGKALTIINGQNARRCFTASSTTPILIEFTLQNGYVNGGGGGAYQGTLHDCEIKNNTATGDGGGTWCSNLNNCIISGNKATGAYGSSWGWGGGSYYGTLTNCTLSGNTAERLGGGSYGGTLNFCTLTENTAESGGGAYSGTLNNCTLSDNSARRNIGGGACDSTLNNCLVARNEAGSGGGVHGGTLRNCTVVNNYAHNHNCGSGGVRSATVYNSIVAYNKSWKNVVFWWGWEDANSHSSCDVYNSRTSHPNHNGNGNINDDPKFGSDYKLESNSPCRNKGNNEYVVGLLDRDGNRRINGTTVDMGAYEYWASASPLTYTVSYNANGGSGNTVNSSHTYNISRTLTPNGFTRTGYTFAGWATSSGGSAVYADGASVLSLTSTHNGTVTLFARWNPITYSVNYHGNGSTGGTMENTPHTYGTSRALRANAYTRTGYTFAGWAIGSPDNAVSYVNGASVLNLTTVQSATLTLYAKWNPITYTVAYNGNGHNSGSTASSSHDYGTPKALTANGFVKNGHSFTGWATSASGNVVYADKHTILNLRETAGTVTLFAKWSVDTYTVTFNVNGGGTVSPSNKSVVFDSTYGALPIPTRTGYVFKEWRTAASGGTLVTASTKVAATSNHTLFAQWEKTCTVTFLGVGAEISTSEIIVKQGSPYGTLPVPEREGYVFIGWFTEVSGGTKVSASTLVYNDHALYARWEAESGDNWADKPNRDEEWYKDDYQTANPLYIGTSQELAQFAWRVNQGHGFENQTIVLTNDLDMTAYYWTPAGDNLTTAQRFTGTFDGQEYVIQGITIDAVNTMQYAGFFGYVGGGGTVRNVNLANSVMVIAYDNAVYVGGVAGMNNGGIVTNCSNRGAISVFSGNASYVGGIVGDNYGRGVTIVDCINNAMVEAFSFSQSYVGGMVGRNNGYESGSDIERSQNNGEVFSFSFSDSTASGSSAGGVAGRNMNGTIDGCMNEGHIYAAAVTYFVAYIGGIAGDNLGSVRNCQNNGAVTAFDDADPNYYAGGVVGRNNAPGGSVKNCSNSGEVSASFYVGGLSGWNNSTIENCFNSGAVNASSTAYGIGGLVGWHDSGKVSNCYWKKDGTDGLVHSEIGHNQNGITEDIRTFTDAPGTFTNSVTVNGTATTSLLMAPNAWVTAKATSGDMSYSDWTLVGSPDGYPVLACFDYCVPVLLDAQGGTVSQGGVNAVIGKPYDLPEPERKGFEFEGWFTEPDGEGTLVDENTIVEPLDDDETALVLYAKWTQTHTLTTPVLVPYSWLDQWKNVIADYEDFAEMQGVNGVTLWESYVAGLIPTNAASRFLITNFVVKCDNGKDAVATLDWTPRRADRVYTVWGKTNLMDTTPWYTPTNSGTRFFKVEVKLLPE